MDKEFGILRACYENNLTYLKENEDTAKIYLNYCLLECVQGNSTECFFYLIELLNVDMSKIKNSIDIFNYATAHSNFKIIDFFIKENLYNIDLFLYKACLNNYTGGECVVIKHIINNYFNHIKLDGLIERINLMYKHECYNYYTDEKNVNYDLMGREGFKFIREFQDKYLLKEKIEKELKSTKAITKRSKI